MDWQKIEIKIGETVPKCVKTILDACGFDTLTSISGITDILHIENVVSNQFYSTIQSLNCSHSEYYKKQSPFAFLPGHADFIRAISKIDFSVQNSQNETLNTAPSTFERMVNDFHNSTDKNRAKYSDFMRYFATYTFLKAGRSCYEFLKSNLPLPSVKTVCK